jgi:hypothetical protein
MAVVGVLTALSGAAFSEWFDLFPARPQHNAWACSPAANLHGHEAGLVLFVDRQPCRWIVIVLR